jgi:ClpX C4-type zinc finger protein
MKQSLPMPPVLDGARVLEYAVLDESVSYSGHSSLFIDGKELGPVPCLAICQVKNEAGVLLFHCSGEWRVLGAAEHPTVAEAKDCAESIYRGVSAHWIEVYVPEHEAETHLDEAWQEQRCGACRRRPDEIERLITKNQVRLCDSCIREFYKILNEES